MTPRASWKGYLEVGRLVCPVALYTAASTAERVSFHTVDRATGRRLRRQFVDRDTGVEVPRDEQVKGYEVGPEDYVVLEPDELAAALPEGDRTLAVEAFLPCDTIDDLFLDRPYYLAPTAGGAAVYAILREGMRKSDVAALATAVLFRRIRTVLIRPAGEGMVATTLNFDYEVRPEREAFADIPETKVDDEMLALARHIIETKTGTFDPAAFDDRYEAAVVEFVRARAEGRKITPTKRRPAAKVIDLMDALRRSAAAAGEPAPKSGARAKGDAAPAKGKAAPPKGKAAAKPKPAAKPKSAAEPKSAAKAKSAAGGRAGKSRSAKAATPSRRPDRKAG